MDLFKAARLGDPKTILACIHNGEAINAQDKNGFTALMWAVDSDQLEAVKTLVKAKANLNLCDQYGQTALILAAGRNNTAILQVLISARADLNLKMITGVTALTLAIENKKAEAAALLKKAGAKA